MRQLFDELDENGNIVQYNIMLVPGLKLAEGHTWVEHAPLLEEVKASKKSYIETQRTLACSTSVSALGHEWQVDNRSQSLLSQAILLAQAGVIPAPSVWRSLDNTDVPVTLDSLKVIAAASAVQTQEAYIKSWELKARVDAATTVAEVDSIEWV